MLTHTLHIKNASLAYDGKTIFKNINLTLPQGKWIGLIGTSGIGKSSLLRLVADITLPKEEKLGCIEITEGTSLHNCIAYMAQTDLLLPWRSVLDNATLSLKLCPSSYRKRKEKINYAKDLLKAVGLEDALDLYPHQLSGGMRQRVALIRTLLADKPIVLMDEPFSALDTITRYKLQDLAAALLKDKTVLFITHDPIEALRLSHEIYVMKGKPAQLKHIVTLSSTTPRKPTHPDLLRMQDVLLQELLD